MDLIGKTLGQFQIIEELGKGGMATVYKAYQPNLQRHVAIKVLSPKLSDDMDLVKRFQREARSAAAVHHPNVIVVYDVGSEGDTHYIVAEHLEGMTLAQLLEQTGALPQKRVLNMARQLAGALDFAHSKGMIHRDIKPSNIMVDPARDDHVTLMDFGLVQISGGSRLTQTGFIMGTPDYMSPEQAKGEEIDHRTDIYSLGVMLYHMLTGNVPFEKTTPHAVLIAHIMEEPPTLTLPDRLAPQIDAVVRRSMAKEPSERYEWAGDLARDLTLAMTSPASSVAGTPSQVSVAADAPTQMLPGYGQTPPGGVTPGSQTPEEYGQTLLRDVPPYPQTPPEGFAPGPQTPEEYGQTLLRDVPPYPQTPPEGFAPGSQTPAGYGHPPPGGVTPYPQTPPEGFAPGSQTLAGYGHPPPGGVTPYPQMPAPAVVSPEANRTWIWLAVVVGALVLLTIVVAGLRINSLLRQASTLGGTPTLPATTATATVVAGVPETATPVPSPKVVPSTSTLTTPPVATLRPISTPTTPPTSTPTVVQAPEPGQVWLRPLDDVEMIYVPAGQFEMGSSEEDVDWAFEQCGIHYDYCTREGYEREQPPHTVVLDAFWIDRTEVTNAQYADFLNRQGNQQEGGTPWLGLDEGCLIVEVDGKYQAVPGYADHPVVCVSWFGAVAYSRSVEGRLPTEAEWEYAARGPQSLRYPWGEAFDGSKVNFCDVTCTYNFRATEYDDGYGTTAPVGSYPGGASWSGALDMAGNVWEWTQTRFDGYPYDASDGREEQSPVDERTLRGGSFTNLIPNVRGAYRAGFTPDNKFPSVGLNLPPMSRPRHGQNKRNSYAVIGQERPVECTSAGV